MNSNDVRNMIHLKLQEEDFTHAYYNLLRSRLHEHQAQEVLNFTVNYLHNSVNLMDEVYGAVAMVNAQRTFQPIFDAALLYWGNQFDFIPDHLGIPGICDDAYLTMTLMHQVANSPVPSSGQVLIPGLYLHLQEQNNGMACIIGAPLAAQLNAVADQTYQSLQVQNALNGVFKSAKLGKMFARGAMKMMQNAFEHNPFDQTMMMGFDEMGMF